MAQIEPPPVSNTFFTTKLNCLAREGPDRDLFCTEDVVLLLKANGVRRGSFHRLWTREEKKKRDAKEKEDICSIGIHQSRSFGCDEWFTIALGSPARSQAAACCVAYSGTEPARETWTGGRRLASVGVMTIRNLLRTCLVFGAFVVLLRQSCAFAGEPPVEKKIRIVLVGDSTVNDGGGWGAGFQSLLTDRAECINTAANGRSTMSFMKEGKWTNALALKGDYYLIQFGHNNEPGKPGRSTDMPTFVSDMKKYVDDTRAIGAKPVLVTPLTRRRWDKTQSGKINSSLTPYADAVKEIGAEKKVPSHRPARAEH